MTKKIGQETVTKVFDEMWNLRKAELVDELFAKEAVIHFSFDQNATLADFKTVLPLWFHAFPDLIHYIDDMIPNDDKVAVRWHGHVTHQGEFDGIPATGINFFYSGITIFRLNSTDKIIEAWVYSDLSDMIQKMAQAHRGKQ